MKSGTNMRRVTAADMNKIYIFHGTGLKKVLKNYWSNIITTRNNRSLAFAFKYPGWSWQGMSFSLKLHSDGRKSRPSRISIVT